MPKCAKCDSVFSNYTKIDGKTKNLSSRKYCLSCSPWGKHNTKQLDKSVFSKLCNRCDTVKPANEFYSRRGSITDLTPYCIICHNKQAIQRQQKLKRRCVEYKGSCCQSCGYSKYIGALEFHHIEPQHKDFTISHLGRTSFDDKVKAELDKCILLCANCHRETHARSKGVL